MQGTHGNAWLFKSLWGLAVSHRWSGCGSLMGYVGAIVQFQRLVSKQYLSVHVGWEGDTVKSVSEYYYMAIHVPWLDMMGY